MVLMDARQLLQPGDPRAALEVLKQEIRKAPRAVPFRVFLFQLFRVLGLWGWALAQLAIAAPADLTDLIWTLAQFLWVGGREGNGFIPTRYPGSAAAEPILPLARRTEWVMPDDGGSGSVTGLGQRVFTTGDRDHALLDLRCLTLDGDHDGAFGAPGRL